MNTSRMKKWTPLLSLPLILAACLALWVVTSNTASIEVQSTHGVWDLRSFDFSKDTAILLGAVEFIPNALLTPEEFAARADEIQIGRPQDAARYATSRLRILLPEDKTFMLQRQSIDYAYRVYINGKWMADVGLPGDSLETSIPNTANQHYTDEPVQGEIVIVQQSSNFVHRESGWHDGFRIGTPQAMQQTSGDAFIVLLMGCFLALFLVHLTLFCILPSYRANLFFSLFCLVWFLRTGVTDGKLFSTLMPTLGWVLKFRMEYLTLPITGILIILLLRDTFPGVLPRWFQRAVYALSGLFIVFFLFADTVSMSYAMFGCYAYQALSIVLILIFFACRFRQPSMMQAVSLSSVSVFLYAGLRDMFYYSNIVLPPFAEADISRVAMLFFIFCQMTAMFIGTVHAAEEVKAIEQRLAAENAALDRMNRMKGDLIATISHETRTPLAVLSGYAEIISMEMRHKGVDDQTARDLSKIADETQRIASIMEEMQKLSRAKDADAHKAATRLDDLIDQVARLYTPILAQKKTALHLDVAEGLPSVWANADEITQVLFNLLSNARNHTENGLVRIAAKQERGGITLSVTDTGEGVRAAFLPHVFEKGLHDNPNGSGLGLSICRDIVREHGGEIWMKSEEGKGTTVSFHLPVLKEGMDE